MMDDVGDQAPVAQLVYTVNEACAVLRLSRYTLYELMNTKQLRSIKVGHRRLVAHVDLVEFVDGRRSEAAAS